MGDLNFSLEAFECPVCFGLPESEIFLCKNGHNICGKCCETLSQCPQCRQPYSEGKTRNRNVENFLAMVEVPCPHRQSGCLQKIPIKDLKEHERMCKFNKNFNVCQLLGFKSCPVFVNKLNLRSVMDHLEAKHGVEIMDSANIECILCGLTTITGDKLVPCTFKLLARIDAGIKSHFLLCPHLNREFLFVSILHICGDESLVAKMRKFQARFLIKSVSNNIPDLEWSSRPLNFSQLQACSAEPMRVRIPLELLSKHYVNTEGHLRLNVEIL